MFILGGQDFTVIDNLGSGRHASRSQTFSTMSGPAVTGSIGCDERFTRSGKSTIRTNRGVDNVTVNGSEFSDRALVRLGNDNDVLALTSNIFLDRVIS